MAQAFSGIRILDFSQVIAGPYAAQLCNMLGAEVIKIEQPGVGDQMRSLLQIKDPEFSDMTPGFISYNSGKRSLAIDLKAPDAKDVITRLVKQSDVVVENFRAGVIEKLGFGYEAIKAIKPDIVYCSISGYGQKGPKAGIPAYDGAVQAASGGWAFSAQVESSVIANGKFVVKSNAQEVQHLEGGTVGAILVTEGQQVKKGQVLVRLDSKQVESELEILKGRLIDLTVEQARLISERDGNSVIKGPKPPFALKRQRSAYNAALPLQQTLLTARLSATRSQLSQLEERKRQTEEQIRGFKRVRRARVIELEQSQADLVAQQRLDKKRLIRKSVLRQTLRQVARARGDIGDIDAKVAGAKSRLAEAQFRISELKRTERSKILDQLKLNQSQLNEAREKYMAASSRSTNLKIRSPRSGLVHELKIHTVGGVIRPGQTVMSVIPQDELLLVSAKIQTHEIDQVFIGQPAVVRIGAFKQRITPELEATVTGISPDESKDEASGQSFFSAKIAIKASELKKLGGKKLTARLPAEVFIQGKKRRVITYLTQPLADQMALTFREE